MKDKKLLFPALLGEDYAERRLSLGAIAVLLLLAGLIALNACLGALPMHITAPDVTGSETFRLSGAAKDWLADLDESVTLYLLAAGGEAGADADLYGFLQEIARASEMIRVKVLDPEKNATALAAYGATGVTDQSILVVSTKRHRVIPNGNLYYYYYPYSEGGGTTISSDEYRYMLEYWTANDPTGSYVTQLVSGVTAYFDGGSRLVNAIQYVLAEKVSTAYLVTSGGNSYPDAALLRNLSNSGYEVYGLESLSQVPTDCELLMLYAPASDISEEDATRLSEYLEGGGRLMLLSTLTETPKRLETVLSAYGMSFDTSKEVVCDGNPNSMTVEGSPYLFYAQIQSQNAATADYAEQFVVYAAHAIGLSEVEGVTVTPWLYTTQAGYLDDMNNETPLPEKAVHTVGATAQKGETRIVWLSCAQSFNENVDAAYASGGNSLLLRYGLDWLSGTNVTPVAISPTVIDTSVLGVTYNAFIIWSVILVLLLPTGVIAAGAAIRYTRKKR